MRLALLEAVEAAFALDMLSKVVELLGLVRDNFRPGRQPAVDAHILRWEARIAAGRRDSDGAAAGFAAAIDAFGKLQRPFWVAVTHCELGEWCVIQGRDAEAKEHLAQARATFEELRATPWVQRARSAMQRGVGDAEPATLAR
jgi:hypothetical protein